MKLLNKKNLQLNIQGTLPRSGYNIIPQSQSGQSMSQSQMMMQQTYPNNNRNQQQQLTASAPLLNHQQQSLLQQKLCFKEKMTKVSEGIYVGNYLSAMDQSTLAKERITHIINCSPSDCPNMFEQDITYLNINIQDNWKTNLFMVIYIILDFLRDALQKNGKVLIHCNQGISRSPSIVIAYLIYTEKINANIALEKLKKKYPYADPNLDFQIQLNEMYKEVVEDEELQRSRIQQSSDLQVNAPFISNQSATSQFYVTSFYNQTQSPKHYIATPPQSSNKALLKKQVMNNSQHITISTPDLPAQKLNYDSYIQMQNKQSAHKKQTNHGSLNNLHSSGQQNGHLQKEKSQQQSLSQSINLSNHQHKGQLDIIDENKDKQSAYSSSSLKSPSDSQVSDQLNFSNYGSSHQNSPQQFFLKPDLSSLKANLSLEQNKQLLFKRTDSQNTNENESDIDYSNNKRDLIDDVNYFLQQKVQLSENQTKEFEINKCPLLDHSLSLQEKYQQNKSNNNEENQTISAQQALQMSSHSQQDQNCDENTEILGKSPSPLKKNIHKTDQFEDKDDEMKNKLSDSDIDPLDSTDIQDFNTDTSASFSFDVSTSFKSKFKSPKISAKVSNHNHIHASYSSQTSSTSNKFIEIKSIENQTLNCSEVSS